MLQFYRVPSSLVLIESIKLLCIGDQRNGRVQCINSENGEHVRTLKPPEDGVNLVAVDHAYVKGKRERERRIMKKR